MKSSGHYRWVEAVVAWLLLAPACYGNTLTVATDRPSGVYHVGDVVRLSKGTHRIEIGLAKGGCCQRSVYAVIKNGMVTNVEFQDCKGCAMSVSKELLALIEAARREIRMPSPSKWRPIPVAEFLKSPAQMSELVISWGNWCIQICISWGGAMHCYYCCAWPPKCGTDTIATGPL
jgi:hypothetical protein